MASPRKKTIKANEPYVRRVPDIEAKPTFTLPSILERDYQRPAFDYWINAQEPGLRSVDCWARRMGKDLSYMSIAAHKAYIERVGLYVHFLPEAEHARRTIWDGFTNEGDRLIDVAFPQEIREKTLENEMRIEFKNGSAWQLGGSNEYDRWVGGNPVYLVYSEFALGHPRGWDLMRPILKLNGGGAAFISTPRGYNHFFELLQLAKKNGWHWSHINALEAGVMTQEDIDQEIRDGMPEELARQEYLCDFSAANVGAILGRHIEKADKEGRLMDNVYDQAGAPVDVSLDLGYRDTTAVWFWQPWHDAYGLVDYDEDNNLVAEQWIQRLADKPYTYGTIYLPHDGEAKTFTTRNTVHEQFINAVRGGVIRAARVEVIKRTSVSDRINAARSIMQYCRFDRIACAQGLLALRQWGFKYDEERKTFSREPDHNWASHCGDSFSYGAQKMRFAQYRREEKRVVGPLNWQQARDPRHIQRPQLAELWEEREQTATYRSRIE